MQFVLSWVCDLVIFWKLIKCQFWKWSVKACSTYELSESLHEEHLKLLWVNKINVEDFRTDFVRSFISQAPPPPLPCGWRVGLRGCRCGSIPVFTTLRKSVRFFGITQKPLKGDCRDKKKSRTFPKGGWPWTPLDDTHCFKNQTLSGPKGVHLYVQIFHCQSPYMYLEMLQNFICTSCIRHNI